jgi:hypothetical protein
LVFSFEFDQICLAELPEESVPWYLFCTEWRIKSAAEIITGSRIFKVRQRAKGWRLTSAITPIERKKNPTLRHQSRQLHGGALQPNGLIGRVTRMRDSCARLKRF